MSVPSSDLLTAFNEAYANGTELTDADLDLYDEVKTLLKQMKMSPDVYQKLTYINDLQTARNLSQERIAYFKTLPNVKIIIERVKESMYLGNHIVYIGGKNASDKDRLKENDLILSDKYIAAILHETYLGFQFRVQTTRVSPCELAFLISFEIESFLIRKPSRIFRMR